MTSLVLTPAERKALKSRAHHLDPVVMIGDAGLSASVIAEADRALKAHGLIKVRVLGDDRELRREAMDRLCEALDAAPVQMIGKLLVVYRPRPEDLKAEPAAANPRRTARPVAPRKPAPRSAGFAKPPARSGGGPKQSPRSASSAKAAAQSGGAGKSPARSGAARPPRPPGAPKAAAKRPTTRSERPGSRTRASRPGPAPAPRRRRTSR